MSELQRELGRIQAKEAALLIAGAERSSVAIWAANAKAEARLNALEAEVAELRRMLDGTPSDEGEDGE